MTKPDEALNAFQSGFTCSAAVFSAFSEDLGLDTGTARKIACGFGGGISKTGNICGAVSGAVMVIGLKYGKMLQGDDAATDKTRTMVREFIREFTARNGSVNCTDLLGLNLGNPDEYAKARDNRLFATLCPALVSDAVTILETLLENAGGEPAEYPG